MTRLVDLSMPVHRGHAHVPARPAARRCSCTRAGRSSPSGSAPRSTGRLAHCELPRHPERPCRHALRRGQAPRGPDAPGVEGIPLEYCFSDGVVLDFTDKRVGLADHSRRDRRRRSSGSATRSRSVTSSSSTRAPARTTPRSGTAPTTAGMTAEATRHLISQGVRMMGIDAITFDPPVWAMFEEKHFWEAHRVMMDEDYWHLENLMNLDSASAPRLQALRASRSSGWGRRPRRCVRSRSSMTEMACRLVWFDDAACADVPRRRGQGGKPRRDDGRGAARPARASSIRAGMLERRVDAGPAAAARATAGSRATRRRSSARRSRPGGEIAAAYERLGGPRRGALVGLRRGLRGGELRRPAGDVPERRGGRRGLRPRRRVLGVVLQRASALLPRRTRARSTISGWRWSCSGWSTPTRPACCSPSTRCSGAATGCSIEAVYGLGEQVVSGEVTPDHYVTDRPGRRQALERSRTAACSTTAELRDLAELGTHARGALRRRLRTSSGRSRRASSTCSSRGR